MSNASSTPVLRVLVLSILFFISLQINYAQPAPDPASSTPYKNAFIRVSMHNGSILKNNTPLFFSVDEAGNVFHATQFFSIEYGWQMLGGKEWHQTCKYPRMGLGVDFLRIMNRNELGNPLSVYGFYDGIYFGSKRIQLTNRLAAGFTYSPHIYDPDDAFPNTVFSTRLNAFAELGMGVAVKLNDRFFIEPGFRFNHISNGNIREPQRGINVVSYQVALRSALGYPAYTPVKIPLSGRRHRHEVLAFLGMGSRQIDFNQESTKVRHETFGLNYLMANLHLGYNYEMTRRFKLGSGVDILYDGANGQPELAKVGIPSKSAVPFHDKMGLSVFVGGETAIDRLSIVTTLSYIVAQTRFESSSPAFEQRLGFKYHFYRDVFAGVNVRATKFRAAKAVEFNVGVRRVFERSH